ncbi:MAG: hypothetical protein HPY57_16085 [Ignavibacteria bacterium]|nr:hypothetical protein [Ignavibacteria bacterium]
MKYLKTYDIFEKSSLTALGIPNEVMKNIQYNYELEPDAKWERLGFKKDLQKELKKNEKGMFLEISVKYIKVIINLGNDEYMIQYFNYDNSNWGSYNVEEREPKTRTQLLIGVNPKHIIYKLVGSNFQERPKAQRMVQKEMKILDDTTAEFKLYTMKNFNRILQRIYGRRFEQVMKKISENIANIKPGATADEIYNFLKDNKKLAEKAKEYEQAKSEEDMLRIKNLEQKYNSLPVIDEYLINFEVEYSEKYGTRLNIHDLIKTFGKMMVETAFMFYLYTGRLMEMRIESIKLKQMYKNKKFQ